MTTRRALLQGGCGAVLLALSGRADAIGAPRAGPRIRCPHTGCRHHRPGSEAPGSCGMSLRSRRAVYDDGLHINGFQEREDEGDTP